MDWEPRVDYDTTGEIKSDISPSSTLSKALSNKYDENSGWFYLSRRVFSVFKKDYRKYALMAFLNIPLQISMYLIYGY